MKHAAIICQSVTPHRKPAVTHGSARTTTSGSVKFIDNRPEVVAQRRLAGAIHTSPAMVAQRQQLRGMFGEVAQFQGRPEDEELQGQSAPMQFRREAVGKPNVSTPFSPLTKLPVGRSPGIVQRMVLLTAGKDDIDRGDLVVYNMIDYALNKVGGPVVSAWDAPDLSTLKLDDELFVVEHGKPGVFDNPRKNMGKPTMLDKVIAVLTHTDRGLPKGFSGTIHVTACWAGVGTDLMPSIVSAIQMALKSAGRTGITVLGAKGPTTGYRTGLVPRVVNPEYTAAAMHPPEDIGSMNPIREQMKAWLKEHKEVDFPVAASTARELTSKYVPAYVQWLEEMGYLLEAENGFVRVQS